MTFDEIWRQLERKRPKIAADDAVVEFRAANLRALLQRVYSEGRKSASGGSVGDAINGLFAGFGGH